MNVFGSRRPGGNTSVSRYTAWLPRLQIITGLASMCSDQKPSFLCVCGQAIPADPDQGGSCSHCGRHYSGQAVNVSMTMTMIVDGDVAESPSESSEDDDEMVGRSLDHFTVLSRLGSGGMGAVYRAMDESLQRYVALKVIRRRGDDSRTTDGSRRTDETAHVESLLQEARAQARVNHANVVHIYFVSRDENNPYLAMELVPGDTLSDRIGDRGLAYDQVVGIGLQVAQALQESAKFGIVHGDIKPSNILLHDDLAKLSDFGLAHRISGNDTGSGRIVGTPNYMAPETCRGQPQSSQADMYSFGVMLFEMTFGRLPYTFRDTSVMSRLDAHQHAAPEFPEPWPAEVPESWRPFLARLLQKKPEDRYAGWPELIDDMHSLRPLRPVTAGRVQRGIAWCIDLSILISAVVYMIGMSEAVAQTLFPTSAVAFAAAACSGFLVPAGVMWWVRRGGTSPGKKLMQLRVVDRHGLGLDPRVLAQRSIIQFLPVWLLPGGRGNEHFQIPVSIYTPVWMAMCAYLVVDVLLALVRRDGRSLHDQFFGTRVVLTNAPDSS